ncbi:hypothetical protein BDR07DRAFT_1417134 [Suillus spraguei]|nr:hypothetical protein BDR07DRAFT_1417134 [Suillus spraguei]
MDVSRLCQCTFSVFKSSNRLWTPESKRPDIIFLQEVTCDVRTSILANLKVREAFLVTDAEDQTSFDKLFAFDLELQREEDGVERGEKFMLGPVSRVKLPSKYRRCALSVDIIPPSTPTTTCRLVNVHLDSLGDTDPYRTEQMEILTNLLREPGCGGGLIVGDFNAISPKDHTFLDKNGLVGLDGATWGVGLERHDGLGPGRLDKVAMSGVDANDMEILRPCLTKVPKPGEDSDYIPCITSSTFGLAPSTTI